MSAASGAGARPYVKTFSEPVDPWIKKKSRRLRTRVPSIGQQLGEALSGTVQLAAANKKHNGPVRRYHEEVVEQVRDQFGEGIVIRSTGRQPYDAPMCNWWDLFPRARRETGDMFISASGRFVTADVVLLPGANVGPAGRGPLALLRDLGRPTRPTPYTKRRRAIRDELNDHRTRAVARASVYKQALKTYEDAIETTEESGQRGSLAGQDHLAEIEAAVAPALHELRVEIEAIEDRELRIEYGDLLTVGRGLLQWVASAKVTAAHAHSLTDLRTEIARLDDLTLGLQSERENGKAWQTKIAARVKINKHQLVEQTDLAQGKRKAHEPFERADLAEAYGELLSTNTTNMEAASAYHKDHVDKRLGKSLEDIDELREDLALRLRTLELGTRSREVARQLEGGSHLPNRALDAYIVDQQSELASVEARLESLTELEPAKVRSISAPKRGVTKRRGLRRKRART